MKGVQKDKEFYVVICDPREIIKLVDVPKPETIQEAQRPWTEARVKEIANYVAGKLDMSQKKGSSKMAKGIIPNCPILNLMSPFAITENPPGVYTFHLPQTEQEIAAALGKVEILDGQHRLIAFSDSYRQPEFKDADKYEMAMVMFQDLTLEDKRELFMISNEKQEAPSKNVLRAFKKWLGLLSADDDFLYQVINKLNDESGSPLNNRINVAGNKKKKTFSLNEVSRLLKKCGVVEKIRSQPTEKAYGVLAEYLNAWAEVYSGKFNVPTHPLGKISGLRYIMTLYPYIYEIATSTGVKWQKKNLVEIIMELKQLTGGDDLFDEPNVTAFSSETGTIILGKSNGDMLKKHYEESKGSFTPY